MRQKRGKENYGQSLERIFQYHVTSQSFGGALVEEAFVRSLVPSHHKLCSFLLFFSCCHKVAFRAFLWLLEKSGENSFARNDSSRTVSEVRVDRTWPSFFKKALFKIEPLSFIIDTICMPKGHARKYQQK